MGTRLQNDRKARHVVDQRIIKCSVLESDPKSSRAAIALISTLQRLGTIVLFDCDSRQDLSRNARESQSAKLILEQKYQKHVNIENNE